MRAPGKETKSLTFNFVGVVLCYSAKEDERSLKLLQMQFFCMMKRQKKAFFCSSYAPFCSPSFIPISRWKRHYIRGRKNLLFFHMTKIHAEGKAGLYVWGMRPGRLMDLIRKLSCAMRGKFYLFHRIGRKTCNPREFLSFNGIPPDFLQNTKLKFSLIEIVYLLWFYRFISNPWKEMNSISCDLCENHKRTLVIGYGNSMWYLPEISI